MALGSYNSLELPWSWTSSVDLYNLVKLNNPQARKRYLSKKCQKRSWQANEQFKTESSLLLPHIAGNWMFPFCLMFRQRTRLSRPYGVQWYLRSSATGPAAPSTTSQPSSMSAFLPRWVGVRQRSFLKAMSKSWISCNVPRNKNTQRKLDWPRSILILPPQAW